MRHNDYDNEDDDYNRYGQSHEGRTGTVSDELKEKIGVDHEGTVRFFGKNFHVDKDIAYFLGPLVNTALAQVSIKFAAKAGNFGTRISGFAGERNAAKVGKGFYYAWLFGLSAADIMGNINKTVQDGLHDIHDLREQAQPLLSVNNDKDVSLSKALTSKYSVLVHARAKAVEHFKNNLAGTLAGAVRAVPNIAMGYYQAKLDNIIHPENVKVLRGYTKDMKDPEKLAADPKLREQKGAIDQEIRDLRKKQLPSTVFKKQEETIKRVRDKQVRHDYPAKSLTEEELARLPTAEASRYEDLTQLGKFVHPDARQEQKQQRALESLNGLRAATPEEARNNDSYRYKEGDLLRTLEEGRENAKEAYRREINALRKERKKYREDLKNNRIHDNDHKSNAVDAIIDRMDDSEFHARMFHPIKNDIDGLAYRKNINDLKLAPAAADALGNIINNKLSNKKVPDTAWDNILELQKAVERHCDNLDRDRIVVLVKDVFKQQERDLGKHYKLESEAYDRTVDAIADAIVNEKLHPQALAEILDNKKIVSFGKNDVDFGDEKDVKEQLDILVNKYNGKIGSKEFYKNAPFTKETLAATFRGMPDDEKPFFAMLARPERLEEAGIPKEEAKKFADAGRQDFVDKLTDMLRVATNMEHGDLKSRGVKSKQIDAMEALKPAFQNADMEGSGHYYVEEHMHDVSGVMRNILGTKKPGELWKEFVGRKEKAAQEASKGPMDHVSRESGEEAPVGFGSR